MEVAQGFAQASARAVADNGVAQTFGDDDAIAVMRQAVGGATQGKPEMSDGLPRLPHTRKVIAEA